MLEFLGLHSATAIPQPLKYLIEDTAARHARLRVGSAASFIQSDDETALLELLDTSGALGPVRLAATVLVSHATPRDTADVLRSLGLSPSVEESDAGGVRLRRTTAVPGSARPVYSAPRTAPPEADVDALQKVKWLLRAEKAGHTGTLDPLATGVLPLCFGAATKFSQLQLDADKEYAATALLGTKTSTGDAEGDVIAVRPVQ